MRLTCRVLCVLTLAFGVVGCAWTKQSREADQAFRAEQRGNVQDLLNRSGSRAGTGTNPQDAETLMRDMDKHDSRLREMNQQLGGR